MSLGPPSNILPAIRSVLAHASRVLTPLRVGTCDVLRIVDAIDDPFSMEAAPVRTVVTTVPCRIREAWQPPYDRDVGGMQSGPVTAWLVMVPRETEIQSTDRLRVVRDASEPTGVARPLELEVVSVFPDRTYGVERRIVCQLVGVAAATD